MTLSCSDLEILLPELMDGRLSDDERDAAVQHLATCDSCSAIVSDLEGVGDLYRRHGREALSQAARDRILQALDDADQDDADQDDADQDDAAQDDAAQDDAAQEKM